MHYNMLKEKNMPKKAKKKKPAKKAPSVQKTLADLCEMVNKLSLRVGELQLEIGALRGLINAMPAPPPAMPYPTVPVPQNPNPWGPTWQPPYEVSCKSKRPPNGLMYNSHPAHADREC